MGEDPGQPFLLVAIQPGVDRIRVAGLQEAVPGYGMGAHPVGDLQQSGTALAHLRVRMMIATLLEGQPCGIVEGEEAEEGHGQALLSCSLPYFPPTDFQRQT